MPWKSIPATAWVEDIFERELPTAIVMGKGDNPGPLSGYRVVEPLVRLGDRHRRIERQVSDPSPFSNSDMSSGESLTRCSVANLRRAAAVAG